MTLRVSEVYASVQGEGPRTGQTTVFVRFGGCNLRCAGWPCDTDHAVLPSYRNEWEKLSPEELIVRTHAVARLAGAKVITLTGGEPFLQPKEGLHMFVDGMQMMGYEVEAFTNGTIEYPGWALDMVSMIMDWKLPGSGEDHENVTRRLNYVKLAESGRGRHAIKFVCKDMHDLTVAISLWSLLTPIVRDRIIWYYGKVWDGDITDAELIEHVMKSHLPWRFNYQLHNTIWPANERGR